MSRARTALAALAALALAALAQAAPRSAPAPAREGDLVLRDFRFASGETLPELRLHYLTLGRLARDKQGHASNAVLVLHGTGGSGRQFLSPQFGDVLYRPGGALDTTRFYVILPDGIGHGRSSKPSDGLHARFPHYVYADMIAAQRAVVEHLGVDHLRLVMGTSMGGMHTFLWGETYPEMMDALMPLACQPVAIVGRNRLWRQMIVNAIHGDPEWRDGEYAHEPLAALRTAQDILMIAGSAPTLMQNTLATRDSADRWLAARTEAGMAALDANDLMYQLEASRDYDPSGHLDAIRAPMTWVNSADDFINPPELGIPQRVMPDIRGARFTLIPAGPKTHGHGTHTWAALWEDDLRELLRRSEPLAP